MTWLQYYIVILLVITVNYCNCEIVPINYCKMCNCSVINSKGCTTPAPEKKSRDFRCKDRQHVLCRFPTSWNTFPCKIRNFSPIAAAIHILKVFNGWRNMTAMGDWPNLPKAANMMRLEWDAELQFTANRLMQKCLDYDSPDSIDYCVDSPRFPVTLYRASGPQMEDMLENTMKWERPHISSKLLSTSCDQWGKIFPGVFFQKIIWATSAYIGCVYSDRRTPGLNRYLLGCVLGPSGVDPWAYQLAPGQTAYEVGPPQSNCPNDTHPDPEYPGLCRLNAFRGWPPDRRATLPRISNTSVSTYAYFLLFLPFVIYFVQVLYGGDRS